MHWIKVEDKLPEIHIPVLVFCNEYDNASRGNYRVAFMYSLLPHYDELRWNSTYEVNYWMPLPKGPYECNSLAR